MPEINEANPTRSQSWRDLMIVFQIHNLLMIFLSMNELNKWIASPIIRCYLLVVAIVVALWGSWHSIRATQKHARLFLVAFLLSSIASTVRIITLFT